METNNISSRITITDPSGNEVKELKNGLTHQIKMNVRPIFTVNNKEVSYNK